MWTCSETFLISQVSVLCNLFNESRSDHQSKEVLGEITDYNKRYSGAPRRVSTPSNPQTAHTSFTSLTFTPVVFPILHPLPVSACVKVSGGAPLSYSLECNLRLDHEKDESSSTVPSDNKFGNRNTTYAASRIYCTIQPPDNGGISLTRLTLTHLVDLPRISIFESHTLL